MKLFFNNRFSVHFLLTPTTNKVFIGCLKFTKHKHRAATIGHRVTLFESEARQCGLWLLQNADVDFDKTAINLFVRPSTSVSTDSDVTNIDNLEVIGLLF